MSANLTSLVASELHELLSAAATTTSNALTSSLTTVTPSSAMASATATPVPPTDLFNQTFSLLDQYGNTIPFSISDLDAWYFYNVYSCIEYASQVGASILLLFVLILLSSPDKRKSPIFLLNAAAVLLNIVRMLLATLNLAGPFFEAYTYLSMDYTNISASATNIPVAAAVSSILLQILVEGSLFLQAHVVCVMLRPRYRYAILAVSVGVAAMSIGHRFYFGIANIQSLLNPDGSTADLPTLESDDLVLTTVSICWFSAVFCAKLGHTLWLRRKMGLRRWGSMQILFVGGCQTLIVPAIFSACQYAIDFPAIGSFMMTLVTLFLPLSTLWANATVRNQSQNHTPEVSPAVQMHQIHQMQHRHRRGSSWVAVVKNKLSFRSSQGSGSAAHSHSDLDGETV